MHAAFEYLDLNDEDLEALGELVETLIQRADSEATNNALDDPCAGEVASVVLARLQRTDFGRRSEPTLAVVATPDIETQLAWPPAERLDVMRSYEVAVPALEALGYKPLARLELIVHAAARTFDIGVLLFPASERPERLRATVTTPSGSQHTAVIADDDGRGMIEDVAFGVDDRGPLVVTWHYR